MKGGIKQKVLGWFGENCGIECQEFFISEKKAYAFYVSCMVNKENILSGLLLALRESKFEKNDILKQLQKNIFASLKVKFVQEKTQVQEEIFNGSVVFAVDGESGFLSIPSPGYGKRSIAEPPSESVLRGPREGFIEDIETNLGLIRKRLKTPTLAVKNLVAGRRTKTKISLVYLEDVASKKVVKEIERRIKEFDIDGVIDSFYVQEMLGSKEERFFKRIGTTEKPDVVVAKVLEGRVAIVVDGSPTVLTAPYVYFEDLQSPNDYYDIPARSTIVRILRLMGLLLAVMLPGIYVALQSYQYRVLPINFLISLLNSIEGLSFPPILEILFVLFLFEILGEASVRMPKQLGMALSIIGALILGNTAVQAGIITPPSIVVVAISGITIYIIPNQSSELSVIRTVMTVLGGISGFYGLFIGFFVLVTYLVSIENFGAPYFAPYAPHVALDMKDSFVKQPLSFMKYRPKSFKTFNSVRLSKSKQNQTESHGQKVVKKSWKKNSQNDRQCFF